MRAFIRDRADELEWMCNWVSDQDGQWWPLLFLRPEPGQRMSSWRVVALALMLGTFFGMLANSFVLLTAPNAAWHLNVLTCPLCTSAGFFAIYRATFAYSWNRRAARLTRNR